MKTGSQGAFVISWEQTEADGLSGPPFHVLRVGAVWRWSGTAVRVDGPQDVLILGGSDNVADLRRRAAKMVRRLVGSAIAPARAVQGAGAEAPMLADQCFSVTDGRQIYVMTIVPIPEAGTRLLMAVGEIPPADSDLWVVDTAFESAAPQPQAHPQEGVICFTPGTRVLTELGPRLIETLRPGDRVQTRDNGLEEIIWTGCRRMTGARLFAMPQVRPVRFRSGALGIGRPDEDLVVSPQHRMLLRGPAARALFNQEEVLVAAEDLLNGSTITVDHALREVSYIHLLLPRHNILWANGLETESFHPANTSLNEVDPAQRASLLEVLPSAADAPLDYGDFVRRNLTSPEAAILRHELAA